MGFLPSFVKNGGIRERREITSILERNNLYSVLAHF